MSHFGTPIAIDDYFVNSQDLAETLEAKFKRQLEAEQALFNFGENVNLSSGASLDDLLQKYTLSSLRTSASEPVSEVGPPEEGADLPPDLAPIPDLEPVPDDFVGPPELIVDKDGSILAGALSDEQFKELDEINNPKEGDDRPFWKRVIDAVKSTGVTIDLGKGQVEVIIQDFPGTDRPVRITIPGATDWGDIWDFVRGIFEKDERVEPLPEPEGGQEPGGEQEPPVDSDEPIDIPLPLPPLPGEDPVPNPDNPIDVGIPPPLPEPGPGPIPNPDDPIDVGIPPPTPTPTPTPTPAPVPLPPPVDPDEPIDTGIPPSEGTGTPPSEGSPGGGGTPPSDEPIDAGVVPPSDVPSVPISLGFDPRGDFTQNAVRPADPGLLGPLNQDFMTQILALQAAGRQGLNFLAPIFDRRDRNA